MSNQPTPTSATRHDDSTGGGSTAGGSPPRVSVIIPVYRFGPYSEQAVDSVLTQTYRDFEVIVVDDGSPNRAGVEHLRARFGNRIRLISRENGGPAAARNSGIKCARGPLIAFLDEDDLWEPNFLEEQLAFMERQRDAAMVYSDAFLFGDPSVAGRLLMDLFPTEGEPTLENLLAQRCHVVMSAVLGRREVFERAGLFDERRSFISAEDYNLWLRIAHGGGRIAYQRKPLVHRRIHEQNLTRDNGRLVVSVIAVLEEFSSYDLTPAERQALEVTLRAAKSELALERCKESLSRGDVAAARRETAAIDRSRLGWKGHLALLGLILLPRLVGAAYRVHRRTRSEPTPTTPPPQQDGHPQVVAAPAPGADKVSGPSRAVAEVAR